MRALDFHRSTDARSLLDRAGFACALFIFAIALPSMASTLDPSGDLDTSFAITGKAQFNYKTVTVSSDSRAIIQQAGGKVVIGGGSNNGIFKDYLVMRMNPDGTLDPSFGVGSFGLPGVTIVDMSFDDHINALAQNSDGSRFCGGGISNWDFGIACFTKDGLLDTTFNQSGPSPGTFKSNAPGSGGGGRILGMTFDRSDRLVAIGYAPGPTTRDVFLHRFNTNGTDDTNFGSGGWVRIDVNGGSDRGFDVAVLKGASPATDQLVAVGTNGSHPFIAVLNANGSLDTSSHALTGTTGIFNPTVNPQGHNIFEGVAVDSSNNIYVTGQGPSPPAGGFYVEKYNLANAAAVAQTANLGTGGNDVGFRVRIATVAGNERVYASGTTSNGTDFDVARLTLALGTEFNTGTNLSSGSDFAYDVAVNPSTGYITATGVTFGDLNTVGVTRYEPVNGNLDTGFNGTGKYYAQIQGGSGDFPAAFAVQADGNAIVAGTTFTSNGDYDLLVTRVKTDGTRDTTGWAAAASPAGWDQRGFTAGSAEQMNPGGVAIDSNGKAVVVGSSNGYFAVRYNTNGTLDTSFDTDGIVLGSWGTNSEGKVVAIDGSNNVIVGGDISLNGDFKFSRLAASNGAVDNAFGASGTATVDISAGRSDVLKAIATDPSGRIVAGGACVNSSSIFKMCLARLNSNGSLDTSFNTTGKVFLNTLSGSDTFDIRSLQLLPNLDTPSATDYKIVVAGQYVQSSPSQAMWLIARFNMDGSLDTSFNGTGYKTLVPGFDTTTSKPYTGSANSVALQYDEKLIVVGESAQPDPLNSCCVLARLITVARLNWDGSLDTTYGTSSANPGFTYTSFGSDPSEAYQAYVYPQSNATLKGRALLTPFIVASDFAMTRYKTDPAPIAGAGTPVLDVNSDTGRSNADNITKDTTPTFTGTCSQGETVYLLVNGANTQPRTRQICPVGGTYALTPTLSGVPRTTYSITTQTQTGIGDSAASSALSVTVDAEINPALTISAPSAGSSVLPHPVLSGTSEALADVVATTSGNGTGCSDPDFADGSGNWNCTSSLEQGAQTISVVQTDIAGNVSSATTRSFNVKIPTTTAIAGDVNPSVYGQPVTFTATVTPDNSYTAFASLNGTSIRFQVDGFDAATKTLNAAGVATFTTAALSVGTHTISAIYDENANWFGSNKTLVPDQTVLKADTSTALISSANPSVFGQAVTFTATISAVAPGAGTPTGTVTFLDGASSIGSGTLSGGIATFTTSALAVAGHTITTSYGGDGNFNGSSGSLTGNPQVVNKANTATTVTSSLNPSVLGQSVMFTATVSAVSPGAGTASGTVTFLDGGSSIGTGTLSGGVATFSTSALAVGNHTITTSYGGDGNFNGSTGSLTGNPQVVNKKPTTTTLTSSPKPSIYGQAVTFTATVTATSPFTGTPSGTVTFLDAGSSIGTGTLDGSGVATLTTSSLAVGSHAITANYGADTNFDVSTGTLSGGQGVSKANTSTAAASSANPAVFGQSVTFTATVSASAPGAGTPTGTVTFLDGGSSIGTGSLSGGVATFTTSTLALGNHTITTNYAGDGNFNGSTGSLPGNPQVVNKANTSTALTSSQNPSVFGQSVTFTATISATSPGGGTPTGTVTFLDGVNPVGSGALAGGAATFTTTSLAVGDHTITTSYSGDSNFNGSLGSLTDNPQVVNKADTATALTSSQNPSTIGQAVTFTATITTVAPGAGIATGSVDFLDGGNPLGSGTLDASGIATFTTSALALGSHSITTSYVGDDSFNGSTATLTGDPQVVNKAGSTTALASSVNPSLFGQGVTFTATVAAAPPGSGTPTGSVTFLDGGSPIGSAPLSSGVAMFSTSALNVGSHAITASYGGDANFDVSASALSGGPQAVSAANTTASVTTSANPSAFGQAVTFTATISALAPGAGIATGTVTFLDGGSPIGTGALSGGIATFTTSALTVGSHTITTSYGGDGNFNGDTGSLTGNPQVVNQAASNTAVASSQNPSVSGQTVTFTATVSAAAPGAGAPTGTVTFLDGGSSIGTGTLSGGIATFTTSALPVGSHTITTSYGGDGNFTGNTGSLTGNPQVVNKADATTALSSSQNPSVIGQGVTFTAAVSAAAPGAGTPTGNVTFLDGGSPLATVPLSAGSATLTTSALTLGNHTITSSYSGDANFKSGTGDLTGNPQVVNKPGTTTAVTSSLNPSVFGQTVTFTATVSVSAPGSGTPTGTVTFRDGGTSIGPGTLSGGIATFTTSALVAGNHTISADYGGDANFNTSSGTLASNPQVVVKADTTSAVTSSANPSAFGQAVTFTATLSAVAPGAGAATGTVTFLDGGSPIGTGTLSGGIATFTASALAVGNHTITTTYGGDGNFNGSTGALTGNPQTVNQADTATAVTSSANPSVFGQPATFSATLTPAAPGAGTPTGSVTFFDGASPIGTTTLSSGVATFTTSTLAVGNHTITASYAADANFKASTGSLAGNPQVVNKAGSTAVTQLTPAGPVTVGTSIKLTATVAAAAPGAGMPTGTVTFLDGGSTIGTVALSSGVASMTTSTLGGGSHSITSSYGGDANFKSSVSAVATLSVTPPTRTVTASAGANGSITPTTQYIVDGNTANFTVTPSSGYTVMMSTTCPGGIGTLNNNVYTTRAISTDCSVTATFVSASATLSLTLTDNRAFVRYGGFINYVVTLSNSSGVDATSLSISGAETSPASDLDTANGHWQCFGTAAECLPSGTGAFFDGNITVPANSSVTWIVSIPKRADPPDGLASYAVTVSGTAPVLMQFDTDIFVIFRDAFDVPNGDGAQSVQPATTADWDGSAFSLASAPTTNGAVQNVFEAKAADHSGFRIERFAMTERNWLRVTTVDREGDEHSTAWVGVAPLASLWLGVTGMQDKRELIVLGTDTELDVPIAASASWKVRAPHRSE